MINPKDGYHPVDLKRVPADKRAAWRGVGERNRVGYEVMPKAGKALAIGAIAVRIILSLAL